METTILVLAICFAVGSSILAYYLWSLTNYTKHLYDDIINHIHISSVLPGPETFCMFKYVTKFTDTTYPVTTLDLVQSAIAVYRYMSFPCYCNDCVRIMNDPIIQEVGLVMPSKASVLQNLMETK